MKTNHNTIRTQQKTFRNQKKTSQNHMRRPFRHERKPRLLYQTAKQHRPASEPHIRDSLLLFMDSLAASDSGRGFRSSLGHSTCHEDTGQCRIQQKSIRIHIKPIRITKTIPCITHQTWKWIHADPIRISTKPMQSPSELQQITIRMLPKPMQKLWESQQNLCRNHQNLNKTYAETIRISTKPCRNHQNLNKTMQNPLEIQQTSIRISTIPMQNPSELQQKSIRISTKPMHNPLPPARKLSPDHLQIAQNSYQIQAAGARVNWLIQPLSSSLHPGKPTDPLPQKCRATSTQKGLQPQQAQESM